MCEKGIIDEQGGVAINEQVEKKLQKIHGLKALSYLYTELFYLFTVDLKSIKLLHFV